MDNLDIIVNFILLLITMSASNWMFAFALFSSRKAPKIILLIGGIVMLALSAWLFMARL